MHIGTQTHDTACLQNNQDMPYLTVMIQDIGRTILACCISLSMSPATLETYHTPVLYTYSMTEYTTAKPFLHRSYQLEMISTFIWVLIISILLLY